MGLKILPITVYVVVSYRIYAPLGVNQDKRQF